MIYDMKWYMIGNEIYDRNDIGYEMIYIIENMKWYIWLKI